MATHTIPHTASEIDEAITNSLNAADSIITSDYDSDTQFYYKQYANGTYELSGHFTKQQSLNTAVSTGVYRTNLNSFPLPTFVQTITSMSCTAGRDIGDLIYATVAGYTDYSVLTNRKVQCYAIMMRSSGYSNATINYYWNIKGKYIV